MAVTAQVRGQKVYTGTRVDAWFDMSYTGIAHYATDSGDLYEALAEIAEGGLAYARAISPRDNSQTGEHFVDKWRVRPYIETRVGRPPFPRGAMQLENTSDHALEVEFGNGSASDPGYRLWPKIVDHLTRGIRQSGRRD